VFQGLPREFKVAQSHVGQMAFVPPGWLLVAEGGRDAKTKLQCLRLESRHVYAAQFHIESATWKDETWESAKTIMGNFLALARNWGGYNPRGTPVAPAEPWPR
jgi:GMP synthase-like glutamine amidotransferase